VHHRFPLPPERWDAGYAARFTGFFFPMIPLLRLWDGSTRALVIALWATDASLAAVLNATSCMKPLGIHAPSAFMMDTRRPASSRIPG